MFKYVNTMIRQNGVIFVLLNSSKCTLCANEMIILKHKILTFSVDMVMFMYICRK